MKHIITLSNKEFLSLVLKYLKEMRADEIRLLPEDELTVLKVAPSFNPKNVDITLTIKETSGNKLPSDSSK